MKKKLIRYLHVVDVEPLVDGAIDGGSGLAGVSSNAGDNGVLGINMTLAVGNSKVAPIGYKTEQEVRTSCSLPNLSLLLITTWFLHFDFRGGLARHQATPGLVGVLDNLEGIGLVLGSTIESKLVLGLAIGDLVDAEPVPGGINESGHVLLNILNVVQLLGQRIVDIDHKDLPVSLA